MTIESSPLVWPKYLTALVVCFAWVASGQQCNPDTGVCDKHERCSVWKEEGECLRNKNYMADYCPVSCEVDTATQASSSSPGICEDRHERCHVWASLGECESNRRDMRKHCPKSCNACSKQGVLEDDSEDDVVQQACKDQDKRCSSWAKSGECTKNENYMHHNCPKSCGTCAKVSKMSPGETQPRVGGNILSTGTLLERTRKFGELQKAEGAQKEDIVRRVESTINYLASEDVLQLPVSVRRECKNRHELCTFWQVIGECEKNAAYMQTNCAAACQTCQMIDHARRCPALPDAVPALIPGGLNQMFQRIVRTAPGNRTDMTADEVKVWQDSGTPMYTVHVHSRPSDAPLTAVDATQDLKLPPWVITLDDLFTDEECDTLVQLGYKYEYKRSEDVGAQKFDGTFDSVKSESRTSENAWCSDRDGCRAEKVPQIFHDRMAKIMEIPPENSEDLQVRRGLGRFAIAILQLFFSHISLVPPQLPPLSASALFV